MEAGVWPSGLMVSLTERKSNKGNYKKNLEFKWRKLHVRKRRRKERKRKKKIEKRKELGESKKKLNGGLMKSK